MTVKLTDKVYSEAGSPVQGAVAQAILTNGTSTSVQATDTTDSKGIWAFDSSIAGHQADLPDPASGYWYDVRINVGMQYRLRYGAIKSMMSMVQVAQTIVLGATQLMDLSIAALRVPARTSDPASPAAGQMAYRTDTKALRVYDGTAWYSMGSPIGSVLAYAGSAAPPGYLLCDGTPASRTTYAALFAVLGTTYGTGDGSTTFGIPDLRGRGTLGAGAGTGLTARTAGQAGGEEAHLLTNTEVGAHNHTLTTPNHSHGITDVAHSHTGINHSHGIQDVTHGHYFGSGPVVNASVGTGGTTYGLFTTSGGGQSSTANLSGISSTALTAQSVNASYTGLPGNTAGAASGDTLTATPTATAHNIMAPFLVMNYIIKAT